jgi:hypothetical protein
MSFAQRVPGPVTVRGAGKLMRCRGPMFLGLKTWGVGIRDARIVPARSRRDALRSCEMGQRRPLSIAPHSTAAHANARARMAMRLSTSGAVMSLQVRSPRPPVALFRPPSFDEKKLVRRRRHLHLEAGFLRAFLGLRG